MFRPRMAMKYTPSCAPLMSPTFSQPGARKIATTRSTSAKPVNAARASASLDTSAHRPAEQPRRPDEEDAEDHGQCDRQPQPVKLEVHVRVVGRDQVQQHA